MDHHQITDLTQRLPRGRTLFHYFKDQYALMLLGYYVGEGRSIRAIKQSRFGGLLNKPLLKDLTRALPDGQLTPDVLTSCWPAPHEHRIYRLTVGSWGGSGYWKQDWYQNSRPGYNLVLHLNFSGKHNRPYHRLMQPEDDWHPFLGYGHPRADDELTLAWARLDVDLDDGIALIEEIQNDWIRKARSLEKRLASWLEHKTDYVRRYLLPRYLPGGSAEAFRRYLDDILRPHEQLWDEAMLSATLRFLRNELGIRRIFYHTFASGNRLKGIDYGNPPHSLYTRLPRRFCFQETDEVPGFLMNQRRTRREVRKGNIRFYIHEL